jgi:hypothetical protein
MLVGLVLDIDIFRLRTLAYTIPVLAVLRAILGDMNPEENFAASRILALFLAELLTPTRLGKLHRCHSF